MIVCLRCRLAVRKCDRLGSGIGGQSLVDGDDGDDGDRRQV